MSNFWKTKKGDYVAVSDMTSEHIKNTMNFISTHKDDEQFVNDFDYYAFQSSDTWEEILERMKLELRMRKIEELYKL